jgi:hypothetical protein
MKTLKLALLRKIAADSTAADSTAASNNEKGKSSRYLQEY